jgi:hypothetical protein
MKTKEEVEKEFDEKFYFQQLMENSLMSISGEEVKKIKSFIHQLRKDDIDSLIEWVEEKIKVEHNSQVPWKDLDEFERIKRAKLVGYNEALTDLFTHLKTLNN